jgi:hypothetical protein
VAVPRDRLLVLRYRDPHGVPDRGVQHRPR